jgi:hypothetical protein
MPFPHSRRLRRFVVVGSLALGIAACAGGSSTEQVGLRGDPNSGGTRVPLPTLPSIDVRQPGLYDDAGCAVIGPDVVDCGATAADADRAAADSVDGWRTLAGFVGPHSVTEVRVGDVALHDGSSTVSTDGPWRATGLIRNESSGPVTDVEVVATLVAADGSSLEDVRADVAVRPLRPGEPAPYELVSLVDAREVADVRWSIESTPASDSPDARMLELVTWWDRPAGEAEPVDLYLYREEVGGPRPYLVFGGVTNYGASAIEAPSVIAAWLDDAGRVVAVADTDLVTDPVGATGGSPLAAGSSADFLFVIDRPDADVAEGARLMLWAVGR